MQIRKALTPEKKQETKEADVAKEGEEEDEDDKLLNELEELTNTVVRRKKKRAKKLLAKRLANVTDAQIHALEDGYVDHELFSLSSIKGKIDLMALDNDQDANDNAYESDKEEASDDYKDSDIDSDEERQRSDPFFYIAIFMICHSWSVDRVLPHSSSSFTPLFILLFDPFTNLPFTSLGLVLPIGCLVLI